VDGSSLPASINQSFPYRAGTPGAPAELLEVFPMKMRRIAGAALVALALAACGGSVVEPDARTVDPLLERTAYPPGLIGSPSPVADTSNIHNGYFGSGHGRPEPDTTMTIPG
jgi:hypothetical protein